MATIIDSLIVRLGLQDDITKSAPAATKSLKDLEGQGKATEASTKKLGSTSKETSAGVGELSAGVKTLLVALGAASVAVTAFVNDMVSAGAAVDRLSKNINVNAGEITAWGNAAEELGGKASGLQASLSMLSKAQTQIAVTGESSLVPYMNFLGVSMADANGKARKVTDVLADLSSAAEGKDRPTMHNIFAEMGITEDTINLLLKGRKELDLSLSKQKDYAEQMRKFSGEGTKLQTMLVDLKQHWETLGLTLLNQAAPALEKILGWVQSLNPTFERFLGYLSDIGGWAKRNADFLKLLAAAFAIVFFPVAALGAAIIGLYDDYQVWKKGGDSLINWAQWSKEIDLAVKGMEFLKRVAITAFEAIGTAAKVAIDVVNGDFGAAKQGLIKGTKIMNKVMGNNAGPDESHDQGAKWANETLRSIRKQPAGFEIPGAASADYKPGAVSSAIGQMEGFHKKGSRAQRNHNPGNIEWGDFAKAHGATGVERGGRFAVFPDDATGNRALDALLASKKYAGKTIEQALSMYAPSSENDTKGYAAFVRNKTGATATTTVAQANALKGIPGASNALKGIPGAANTVAMAGRAPGGPSTQNDNRISNHIDSVIINAPSGDAAGIAQAFRSLNIFPAAVAVVGVS